jgi:hypothetical protein
VRRFLLISLTFFSFLSLSIAASEPLLTPEQQVSTALGGPMTPAVASCGGHTLIVWRWYGIQGSLDRSPVTISDTADGDPAVACAGNTFLVAWPDSDKQPFLVVARRVRSDGTLLDVNPIMLDAGGSVVGGVSAASDGVDFLVLWTGDGVYIRKVSNSGAALDSARRIREGFFVSPRVAWTSQYFYVAFADYWYAQLDPGTAPPPPTRLYGARVNRDATVLDPLDSPLIAGPDAGVYGLRFSIATEADRVIFAWGASLTIPETRYGSNCIDVAEVDLSSQVVSSVHQIRCTSVLDEVMVGQDVDIVWDGQQFVLLWNEAIWASPASYFLLSRLDSNGIPSDVPPYELVTPSAGNALRAHLAAIPGGTEITYYRWTTIPQAAIFARTWMREPPPPRQRVIRH